MFLIFGVKSTFFSKSAKIKLKTNNFLIGIVRKDHTFLVVLPSQEGDSSTLTVSAGVGTWTVWKQQLSYNADNV